MKRTKIFTTLLFTIFASLFFVFSVLAKPMSADPVPINPLTELISVGAVLATLTGVASLISVIVNVCKYFRLIPDGTGGRVFAALNLLAFIALAGARIFAPQYSLEFLDGMAGQIATVGLFITGYVFQLGTGQAAYEIIKKAGVPILSYSASNNPVG